MRLCICRDATEMDEYVLCTVQVDSRGVIAVTPDFNRGRRAYKVEAGNLGRGTIAASTYEFVLAESRGKSTNWKTIWQPCLKHAL